MSTNTAVTTAVTIIVLFWEFMKKPSFGVGISKTECRLQSAVSDGQNDCGY
jgi:hypothetical protein